MQHVSPFSQCTRWMLGEWGNSPSGATETRVSSLMDTIVEVPQFTLASWLVMLTTNDVPILLYAPPEDVGWQAIYWLLLGTSHCQISLCQWYPAFALARGWPSALCLQVTNMFVLMPLMLTFGSASVQYLWGCTRTTWCCNTAKKWIPW